MSILDDFDPYVTSTSTADIRKRRRENNIKAHAMKNPGKYTVRDDKGLVIAFGTAGQCIQKLYYELRKQEPKPKPKLICVVCKKLFSPRAGTNKTCSPECSKARRKEIRKTENNSHKNQKNLERYHKRKEAKADDQI